MIFPIYAFLWRVSVSCVYLRIIKCALFFSGEDCVLDILELVRMLRQQRIMMVQMLEQYRFIYVAAQQYIGTHIQQMNEVRRLTR